MKKKIELGTVIFIVIVAIVLASLATYMYLTSLLPSLVAKESFYERISELYKTVEQRYIGDVDDDKAMDSLLSGYVAGIDKYSTYLDKNNYATYAAQSEGKYSGIGVTVKYITNSGLLKVVTVKNGSPADEKGIEPGDFIYKISGKNVVDMTYNDAVTMLTAENGTTLEIVILRDEKEISKSITIGEYVTSSIEYRIISDDVGYVSISEFDNTTFDDFKSAIEKLSEDGAKQFIFDVRNNTGGALSSVVSVLDYLLPEGNLVTLKDKNGEEKQYSSDASSFDKKFVVIINSSTLSAGELFAACVRDFNAGKLVGETTYGKGYAQEIIPLSEGALYLSTKLYYPPNGENFEGVGVSPDVEVKLSPELEDRFYELADKEDLQLVCALEQLGK